MFSSKQFQVSFRNPFSDRGIWNLKQLEISKTKTFTNTKKNNAKCD